MKPITLEELNKKKEELRLLNEKLKTLATIINELKEDEKVKKYIEVDKEFNSVSYALRNLTEEIKYQEMVQCRHYFVITGYNDEFDGHKMDRTIIKTCIHCGLTNRYMDFYNDHNFPNYNKINEVFINAEAYNYEVHDFYDYDEIDNVKKEYDKFKAEYPDATDDIIEEHIKLVKKMKGGKLC